MVLQLIVASVLFFLIIGVVVIWVSVESKSDKTSGPEDLVADEIIRLLTKDYKNWSKPTTKSNRHNETHLCHTTGVELNLSSFECTEPEELVFSKDNTKLIESAYKAYQAAVILNAINTQYKNETENNA